MPGNASANAAGCTARSPLDPEAARAELSSLLLSLRDQLVISSSVGAQTPFVPSLEQQAAEANAFNAEQSRRLRVWGRDVL